jgi:hypothetical protein
MFFAKSGIYTSQYNGDARVSLFGYRDDLLNPWVPVSHQGGDQYGRRVVNGLQILDKELSADPISAIRSGDMFQGGRLGSHFSPEFAGPIRPSKWWAHGWTILHFRVVHVQTIKQVDLETTGSEKGGEVKQAERLRPKIIGRKIVDPRIY